MVNDDLFQRLCDVYGFAPSRALRELVECAISTNRKPVSSHYITAAWRKSAEHCTGSTMEMVEHFARQIERAHGVGEQK